VTPNTYLDDCGPAVLTSTSIDLSGGQVGAAGSCTIVTTVTAPATGVFTNTTSALTFTGGTAPAATATLDVGLAPVLTKSFSELSIPLGGSATLTFTLTNPYMSVSLTGLGFSDVLPAGLVVTTPSSETGSCDSGTITATAGGNTILLSGATLASGASCTFAVNVTGVAAGLQTNTTSTITSTNAPAGAAASAVIEVGDPYQVRHQSNLNLADSVVDLTNAGTSGGNICVNVYTLAADEQLVSCCTCLVTPDGLNSLSGETDLIGNTLTPAVPTSIVVKLVATTPVAGVCNAASLTPDPTILALGMRAWSTTVHALPTAPGGLALAETEFSQAALSASEVTHLASTRGFIQSDGSGFGICASCLTGGLGGQKTD
jgi:hypothetical protein